MVLKSWENDGGQYGQIVHGTRKIMVFIWFNLMVYNIFIYIYIYMVYPLVIKHGWLENPF